MAQRIAASPPAEYADTNVADSPSLLVICGDTEERTVLTAELELLGFRGRVSKVASLEEGLELAIYRRPSVVIYHWCDGDDLALCHSLHTAHDLPLIVLGPEALTDQLAVGTFLPVPYVFMDLVRALYSLLFPEREEGWTPQSDPGELAEEARRYRDLFERASSPILLIDAATHTILDANNQAVALYGYTREELTGMNLLQIVPRDQHVSLLENTKAMIESGAVLRVSNRIHLRKNGTPVPVSVSAGLIEYGGRRVFQDIIQDERERLRQEEALRQQQAHLETLVAARTEELTRTNAQLQQEIAERRVAEAALHKVHAELEHRVEERTAELRRINIQLQHEIEIRKQAEAEQKRLLAQLAQERTQLQQLTETLEQRVQERTSAVRALAAQLSLAEHAERERIARMLHDHIQQLLYGIQWQAHIIMTDLPAEIRSLLDSQFTRLLDLIKTANRDARTLAVELSPPVLEDEAFHRALTWLAGQMRSLYALDVMTEFRCDCIIEDKGRRVLVFQLVRELLFNVVKHAQVNRAYLTLDRDADQMVVIVRDEGVGFDQTLVSGSDDRLTGLGLTSIHRRLALFDGRIEIRSAPGTGTEVTVVLPNPKPV